MRVQYVQVGFFKRDGLGRMEGYVLCSPFSVTRCTSLCKTTMPPVSLNRSISRVPEAKDGVPRLDVVGKVNAEG